MSEHTKGRLTVRSVSESDGSIGIVCDGAPRCVFASIHNGPSLGDVLFGRHPEEQWANARRLVACWNACEEWSTEALEAEDAANFKSLLSAVRENRELAASLKNMTANFRTSLLLVNDPDTRALGMSIVNEATRLLAKHAPKVSA